MSAANCSEIARDMRPGQFWAMNNLRMVDRDGLWEARNVEATKLRRMSVPEETANPHLVALLKWETPFMSIDVHTDYPRSRKNELGQSERPKREFPLTLIESVTEVTPTFATLAIEVRLSGYLDNIDSH